MPPIDRLRPRSWLRAVCAAVLAVGLLAAPAGFARDPDTNTQLDARERFGRGLRLFDDGDYSGALAEFTRAQELSPHPLVLYNIGLVFAAMGRAVEASDTLETVLKDPTAIGADRAARATRVRAEQAMRIARLTIRANVAGADVEVDGVRVGKTPLPAPVRVTSGTRVVALIAPGHLPERRVVTIAGNVSETLRFELRTSELRLGHLALTSNVPGVLVVVDGKPVGETPLVAAVTLAPGRHMVELRRRGYVTVKRAVEIGEGSSGKLAVDPPVDPSLSNVTGGRLALDSSEPDVELTIDGRHWGKYVGSVLVPSGRHVLAVEKDGFDPVSREVDVATAATTTVRVRLIPTPAYRAQYERKARLYGTWGWVGVIGGTAIAGGATGFLVWNAGEKQDAKDDFNRAADERDARVGSHCDTSIDASVCNAWVEAHYDIYEDKRRRDVYGYVGLGVGGAALVAGAVLLLSGDDPSRYVPERPELSGPTLSPGIWAAGDTRGLSLVGRF